ncbi:MAG TPA: SPOR domain-containing protein, partial [Allosphingosinicella sp.]|nr:SPOR domain-containing protein [Allosphingosinicella sp.]
RTPAAGSGTAARPAAAAPTRTVTPAPPAHPARHWVQIANGAPGALSFELNRIRRAAPALMRDRTAWSAANGASGRLLVGPFATPAEARAFLNRLAAEDIAAFTWSSRAGEEVARLPAR